MCQCSRNQEQHQAVCLTIEPCHLVNQLGSLNGTKGGLNILPKNGLSLMLDHFSVVTESMEIIGDAAQGDGDAGG